MERRTANEQRTTTNEEARRRERDDVNEPAQENTQKGGDRSDRAARSGATGERNPEGAENRPEPKNQDEKGMAGPRNP